MTSERPDFGPRPHRDSVAAALAELDGLVIETEPAKVKKRSRDFHWFSPVLKARLDEVTADAVVAPADEAEVRRVLAACFNHDVPVTVRGGGTGNYGQAMPLRGGIVLDTGYLNALVDVRQGWVRAQAGCMMGVLDARLRERGQSLRFHPSTVDTATIGGFVAGGSGGVGSITWGSLRDTGAVRALRVVTVEETPRTLELRGSHARLAMHGFGTAGVITEVELPTAPLTRWLERVVGFRQFARAVAFADALAHEDAILKRLVSVVAAPAAARYLFPHGIDESTHAVLVMVAETADEALDELVAAHGGSAVAAAGSPLYEYAWNHTTLHALKHDRAWTYLQVGYPQPGTVERVVRMAEAFGPDEVIPHIEFLRMRGVTAASGLPLVRFTSEARLAEIIAAHETAGCPVFNPHVFTLEEMGRKHVDKRLVAFKQEVDPKNLLNPGKMLSFERPELVQDQPTAFGFRSQ
ncbi:MAG: FAD-binding oxidoreductase [Pseudomonadota bacterium]